MNVNDDNAEPVTDFGLALAYYNQRIPRRLSDSGAGVNAASMVDMTFVPSDPLSELVWSPHSGLSLKCADFSFSEKKPSLLWDVRRSNMALSPPESITSREITGDKPTGEGNFITSQVAFHVEREVGTGASLVRPPWSMSVKPIFGSSHGYHAAGPENAKTTDFIPIRTNALRTDMAQTEPLCGEHNEVMMDNPSIRVAGGNQTLGLEVGRDSPVPDRTSPGGRQKDLSLVIEEDTKTKMKIDSSARVPSLEKLEYAAENDLQVLGKDARGKSKERLPRDISVPAEASPTNSRIHLHRRKGKEKALSDGDVNERMSEDENDSHESVESSNGADLFSTGKKRWNFEQQLIMGSKREKKQIQESPASTTFVGQDSSFMNWISNMVKGLNNTNQDEAPFPSLSLPLAHPHHGHESYDPWSGNMGFQTLFESLYSSKPKEQETKMSNGDSPIEESKELVLPDKMSGATITQIAFHCKNQKLNQYTSRNGAGPSVKPITLSTNIAAAPEMSKTSSCSARNITSCNLACFDVKDGRNSLGKHKRDSAENNDSEPPPEAKNVGYRCDPLGSLWITRFAPKTRGPFLNLDHRNQNTGGALECSADCTKLIPRIHSRVDFHIDQKNSEAKEYPNEEDLVNAVGKELQAYAPNTEASSGFKGNHDDQISIHKLNSVLTSPRFKNSQAMASVFARRLGALKHIISSDNETHMRTICFYCGKSGHDLCDCSEITETERVNLIRNSSSYDGAEESSCLCIRCFQLDHWAISCPMVPATRKHQSEHGAALFSHFSASKMQLVTGNERHPRMLETEHSHSQVDDAHTICDDGKNSRADVDKHIASSSGDNVLKEKLITPLCNLVDREFPDIPKGMFDAIRKLRLSRTDILKWMNSHTSLLHLNGFFLRVRLGKWEEGLGGTGYFVACITGELEGKPLHGSKKPVCVKIGGRRCLVESQYISNQDFLEDELMAWWCATMRSGGKIPSEDHLKLKFEERKRLGF